MRPAPHPSATPSPGLQALLDHGLNLSDDEPETGLVVITGIRPAAPKPCGAALLRAENPDALIESLIRHCTVNGYTSWPAVATAMEAALRELHAEARKVARL